jgi:tetratricopeptide (TPR) repeat protein
MPNRLSRFVDGVMEACWLLALVVSPLFFNIYSSRVFEPDKITLVRSLALVALAAWLVKLINEGGPRFDSIRSQHATLRGFYRVPLVLPVLGLGIVYLIATIFSVAPTASLFGSYQRLQGTFTTFSYLVLFAALAANLRRRAQAERLLTTIIVTSLPIALYGIIQRFELDPLPWGGDTTARVTANMGNAIFVAAYLIMSAMITLGRVMTSFHAILTEDDSGRLPVVSVVRASIYVFILAVNLIAIWFSVSRGPWLGLLAGLFFFFVLISLHRHARRLTLATIGLATAMAVFLVVLNIPGGPLEALRQVPGVGRLGEVFETEGGTGRVRVLIWRGVVDLMTPHQPLEYPDGRLDTWNTLRPLIGYGPEALYVAFNPFYPPELGQIEARNASPDRSHNETFDALAFTGILGLGVYLALFTAVFYYGFKWLGLVTSARRRNVFLLLVLGGGIGTAIAFVLWQGMEFFGVGLPFGMLLGLIAFLTLCALVGIPRASQPAAAESEPASGMPETWRAIALISIMSAIVAHFTEIHFGIAIVSTRTHFWLLTGLMLVLGFVMRRAPAGAEAAAEPASQRPRRRGRSSHVRVASAADGRRAEEAWAPVLTSALVTSAILVTLGYDFITNSGRSLQAGRIMIDSLTRLPTAGEGERSFAILGMFILTWLAGGALMLLEEPQAHRGPGRLANLSASLGLSLLAGLIGAMIISSHLAGVARITPASIEELMVSAGRIAGIITTYYVLLALVMLGLAGALMLETAANGRSSSRIRAYANRSPAAIVASVVLPVVALVMSWFLNVHTIQADIIYKTGLQFDDSGQPAAAIPLYERALALSPGEDYYYLFLGRSYLNATTMQAEQADREALLSRAEAQLHAARGLNPLNTDHTANLARLNRRWAELLPADNPSRQQRIDASDLYYAQAVRLSPNNAGLWNEWAALALQVIGDLDRAQTYLDRSFELDRKFDQTYQLQGELYAAAASRSSDPETQRELYQRALEVLQLGIAAAQERGNTTANLRINMASAYVALGQLFDAIGQYELILADNQSGFGQWQVYLAISELYAQLGDMALARDQAEQALVYAPEPDRPNVQAWLDRLP